MFLRAYARRSRSRNLPRTRGGVSSKWTPKTFLKKSSPHPRGCFPLETSEVIITRIFPAPAGVFPGPAIYPLSEWNLPRTRGGVSSASKSPILAFSSSPHPRGCFYSTHARRHRCVIFPAPAGVFLKERQYNGARADLPRTRGGVSLITRLLLGSAPSSPHPRGCFSHQRPNGLQSGIFPAPAGVFLDGEEHMFKAVNLPRTRGGVSESK